MVWLDFLQRWNSELLASPLADQLPDDSRARRWLGLPAATEGQIADAEARLKIPLPPSYANFLRVSNGWNRTTHAIGQVFGTSQINWFRKAHRGWILAYTTPLRDVSDSPPDSEYFAYGPHAENYKPAHLKETLQVSEIGDAAVYLLNPQVISKDGEWEAWFLANWLPGVRRYRSFGEMMEAEYSHFAGIEWQQTAGVGGELPDEFIGAPGSPKRRIKKRTKPRELKILGRPYSKWTIEELFEFLDNPEFDIIYGEIFHGLRLLVDPRSIEPLMAMAFEDSKRSLGAASVLADLAPETLREPLLDLFRRKTLERIPFEYEVFAFILLKLREERAIANLVEIMNVPGYYADNACRLIGQFGQTGFDALIEQLHSPDESVRERAADGLLSTCRPEAREILGPLISDPNPAVREIAESALDVLPRRRV